MDQLKELPHDGVALVGLGVLVLGNLAYAVATPVVAVLTARRQNKVDGKLAAIDKTINGDAMAGKPAAVDRIIERLERLEHDTADTRADVRALREGQREILTEVRSQLAYHTDAVERLVLLSRDDARERRKARRNQH